MYLMRCFLPMLLISAVACLISCDRTGLEDGDPAHPNRRTQHDNVTLDWDIIENKWFLGENLKDGRSRRRKPYTPGFSASVRGTDNGVSVRLTDGTTIAYMGDSQANDWGSPDLSRCGTGSECNDPIMILDPEDDDPADGIDARLLQSGESGHYYPLTIPGINRKGYPVVSVDTPFTYPTGVALGLITVETPAGEGDAGVDAGADAGVDAGSVLKTKDMVYLWFATEIKARDTRSFLACSQNGIDFHNCRDPEKDEADVFSSDRFIIVSPVSIDNDIWELAAGVCDDEANEYSSGALCRLRSELISFAPFEQLSGMLVFGCRAGPKDANPGVTGYRQSPVYMAYVHLTTGAVWYFDGAGWVRNDESAAAPVLHQALAGSDADRELYWFGEISVRLVIADNEPFLVMLSNHANINSDELHAISILYRTSSLFTPDMWAGPKQTCGRGYGAYIIDRYTSVKSGTLTMYHMIQGWNGTAPSDLNHEAYGVFTTRLRLRNDGECTPPPWPPR